MLLLQLSVLSLTAIAREEPTPDHEHSVVDAPLSESATRLLDIAFDAASEFPEVPHLKNRGRAQLEVIETCFEMDQPVKAVGFAEQVQGWRKGAALAEFAAYCAQRGERSKRVHNCLAEAKEIADQSGEDQVWRSDIVLVKIALAEFLLKRDTTEGELVTAGLSTGNARVALMLEGMSTEELLDQEFEALTETLEQNDFENSTSLLEVLTDLYDRKYEDTEQRAVIEAKVRTSWGKLPLMVRMEQLIGFAQAANSHADLKEFHRFRTEALKLFEEFTWTPETQIALESRWSALRFQAGEKAAAHADLASTLARYTENREVIYDIYRAEALRSIAEAYQVMGDEVRTHELYLRALNAGVENPNSRPRCDDLVATCCSMVRSGFQPTEACWKRLRAIRTGLGTPW